MFTGAPGRAWPARSVTRKVTAPSDVPMVTLCSAPVVAVTIHCVSATPYSVQVAHSELHTQPPTTLVVAPAIVFAFTKAVETPALLVVADAGLSVRPAAAVDQAAVVPAAGLPSCVAVSATLQPPEAPAARYCVVGEMVTVRTGSVSRIVTCTEAPPLASVAVSVTLPAETPSTGCCARPVASVVPTQPTPPPQFIRTAPPPPLPVTTKFTVAPAAGVTPSGWYTRTANAVAATVPVSSDVGADTRVIVSTDWPV